MKESIDVDPGSIAPGKIRFFDSIQPPLQAGVYSLTATHQVLDIPGETVTPYVASQRVLVDGPRFVLNPAQIHMVYPPANQEGVYDNVLPNIVFNNFSLPWSRPIDPNPVVSGGQELLSDADGNVIPWMGLLTLYPGDMEEVAGVSKAGVPHTVLVSELVKPADPKILPPALGDLFGAGDEKVAVVDMDLTFFQSIAPMLSELPFLAHARVVNTGGKVLLGMADDGCFSLLVGNRLPVAAAKNTIYMVSYEGHQDHLRGSTISGGYTKIRLVLLGSWQFTAKESRGSFIQLMASLCDKGRGGVTLFQMPEQTATAISPEAKEGVDIGYVPMQNSMRQGETATSWYRGPLMPAPTKRDFTYGPYHYSDHAIHYDPGSGIFNHAYSAGWQIGRLLALSDGTFSNGLFNWRNTYLRQVVNDAQKTSQDKIRVIAGMNETAEANTPVTMRTAVQKLFSEGFKNVEWPQVQLRSEAVLGNHLPGIFTEEEKIAIVEREEDPLLMLAKKLKGK